MSKEAMSTENRAQFEEAYRIKDAIKARMGIDLECDTNDIIYLNNVKLDRMTDAEVESVLFKLCAENGYKIVKNYGSDACAMIKRNNIGESNILLVQAYGSEAPYSRIIKCQNPEQCKGVICQALRYANEKNRPDWAEFRPDMHYQIGSASTIDDLEGRLGIRLEKVFDHRWLNGMNLASASDEQLMDKLYKLCADKGVVISAEHSDGSTTKVQFSGPDNQSSWDIVITHCDKDGEKIEKGSGVITVERGGEDYKTLQDVVMSLSEMKKMEEHEAKLDNDKELKPVLE